jgi:hypothetical protein
MKAPVASGAGYLLATGARFFGATTPGDAEVRAAAGVLSAKLRSSEYGQGTDYIVSFCRPPRIPAIVRNAPKFER